MKNFKQILLIFFALQIFFSVSIYSQNGTTQIFVIDSYISTEKPIELNLSFYTSELSTSKLLIAEKFDYSLSDKLTSQHKAKIDISNLGIEDTVLSFKIIVKNSNNDVTESQIYKVDYPKLIFVEKESNLLLFGMLFATVFIIPTPSYAFTENESRFSITKEVPLISFRGPSINYPKSYLAMEFTHIYKADRSNFLRLGYKYIQEVSFIKFISPGLDLVTNFDGFNGIGVGLSLGLFNVADTFILYTRYRYNFQPSHSERNFSELSLGMYTNFFSVHF